MSVYFDKRRKQWTFDFLIEGRRYSGYCVDKEGKPVKTKRAAREAEALAKYGARNNQLQICTADLTFAEAVASLEPNWRDQSDAFNKDRYAKELLKFFGPATPIRLISDIRVQEYVQHARSTPILVWTGGAHADPTDPRNARLWRHPQNPKSRSPATINLYLNVLRQIFAQALKFRDPITGDTILRQVPEVKTLDTPKRKARPVPDMILKEVLAVVPQHVIEAITLTLYFGFRKGEAFRLELRHIDFDLGGVRLFAEEVKDNEDEFLPGAPEAMAFLRRLANQAEERETTYLISWRRGERQKWRAIKGVRSAWATAMKHIEAKFGTRYRWHDIRAAFITHVAITSGGVAAQSLARHADYETTLAYIHVADEVKRAAANRAAIRPALEFIPTKSPRQKSQTAKKQRIRKSRKSLKENGAPEEIRTPDPQIRSLVLYPAELRARFFARAENLCITTPHGKSWWVRRVGGFWPRPAPAVFASRKGCRRFQVPDRAGYIYKCAPRALRVPVLPQEIAHEPAKSNAHTGNSPTCRILCPCP